MLRIMWCRKALAVASMRTQSPRRSTLRRSMRRMGERAWHSEERKALKSCSPSRAGAACAMRS